MCSLLDALLYEAHGQWEVNPCGMSEVEDVL